MIRIARDSRGKFYIDGEAVYVAIKKLISRDLFTSDEVRADIMRGDLIVQGFQDSGVEELVEFVHSESWDSHMVYTGDLKEYIKVKNRYLEINQFNDIKSELEYNRKLIMGQSDLIRMMSSELMTLKKNFSTPSYVTIDEVHKLFPQYNINSLRNMVARNKYFDEKMKMNRSSLHIGEFRLEFRKPTGTKKWLADRVDYVPEKSKTYDTKFKEQIMNRLQHGIRYFWI